MAKKPGPKAKKGQKKKRPPSGVSTAYLADMLGLTIQRLSQLTAEGMPKAGRGMYPTRDAVRWYVEYLRKRQEAQTGGPTKSDLERDILSEKLKQQRGEVFDRSAVVSVWQAAFARLAKGLDALAVTIGRELNLPGEDVKLVRDRIDEMRVGFVRDSREFKDVVEDGSDARKTA